jgi:hypothetical protein
VAGGNRSTHITFYTEGASAKHTLRACCGEKPSKFSNRRGTMVRMSFENVMKLKINELVSELNKHTSLREPVTI